MLSNLLELAGFTSLTVGVYELAGRGWALVALACCLLLLGLAADGVHPVRTVRVALEGAWRRHLGERRTKR